MPKQDGGDADGEYRAKAIARLRRNPQPPQDQEGVKSDEKNRCQKPMLFGPNRKRKVRMLIGQVAELILGAL